MNFHSKSVNNEKYIKIKVKGFNGAINIALLDNIIPKKDVSYTCIACPSIYSATKTDKKKIFPEVYLEECKYKMNKKKKNKFIDSELFSNYSDDSDSD